MYAVMMTLHSTGSKVLLAPSKERAQEMFLEIAKENWPEKKEWPDSYDEQLEFVANHEGMSEWLRVVEVDTSAIPTFTKGVKREREM